MGITPYILVLRPSGQRRSAPLFKFVPDKFVTNSSGTVVVQGRTVYEAKDVNLVARSAPNGRKPGMVFDSPRTWIIRVRFLQENHPPANLPKLDKRILERVMGIEPTFSAWEADVLPLNYTRLNH